MNTIEMTKNTPELETFLWVAKAITKDPTWKILKYIHVENNPANERGCVIAATDGRRLHVARFSERKFDAGNYRLIKQSAAYLFLIDDPDAGTYPIFQGVIPTHKPEDMIKLTLSYPSKNFDSSQRQFETAIKFHALKNCMFNLGYLSEAVNQLTDMLVFQQDELSPLLIKSQGDPLCERIAVVMPCRTS